MKGGCVIVRVTRRERVSKNAKNLQTSVKYGPQEQRSPPKKVSVVIRREIREKGKRADLGKQFFGES